MRGEWKGGGVEAPRRALGLEPVETAWLVTAGAVSCIDLLGDG